MLRHFACTVVLLSVVGCGSEPANTGPTLPVQATELAAAYVANEIAADQKYKDRYWLVSGTVTSIGKEILDNPYIILQGESDLRAVQAVFDKEHEAKLASLQKGQQVRVRCRVRGLMMHVQLDDCRM